MVDGGTSGAASLFRRWRHAEGWFSRLAAVAACIAIWSFAVLATTAAGGTSSSGARSADAPPLVPSDLVVLAPRLTPGEARQIADTERTAVAAAQPTATATASPMPTATAVPPTPTTIPPAPTPRPAAPVAPAPTLPPPPPPPASTPIPPPPAPPTAPGAGLDTSPMDASSRALFEGTNARRASQGLPPLRENGYLNGIARIRSRDMAQYNYFAHISPVTGEGAFSLMDKHGVPYGWAGENLAKNNYPDGQAEPVAEQALWASPPHRENILNPNYTDVGIALVTDSGGMHYFTIVFTGPG